ncbi:hypothetical protein AX15_000298 [Amanita polypyramis BW_CC]|nr:hypothetical protein AX15_000298 [Amanita polypyramis BW_CC]
MPSTSSQQLGASPSRICDSLSSRGNTSFINQQIHYGSGQFCGRIIRIELREVQKADLGRKYARVDRRPLDPPPVVQMIIYELSDTGSDGKMEREILDYDSVEVLGFVCTVDLFPVARLTKERRKTPKQQHSPTIPHVNGPNAAEIVPPPQYISSTAAKADGSALPSPPRETDSGFTIPALSENSNDTDPLDVVHHVDGCPLTEGSKMTSALVGATFVQPVAVDYQGRKSLMFVFADLAVKTEGYFILRYRVFDIFSTPIDHTERAIQAECYGGVFRVYSTKEFPGLQASTELTKQLARWGVRLNIREAERKRRRRDDSASRSPMPTALNMNAASALVEEAEVDATDGSPTNNLETDDTLEQPMSSICPTSRKRSRISD